MLSKRRLLWKSAAWDAAMRPRHLEGGGVRFGASLGGGFARVLCFIHRFLGRAVKLMLSFKHRLKKSSSYMWLGRT